MDLWQFLFLLADAVPSAIRLTVPLLFAALAGLFAERSGVFDIGLEGKMLAAAFAAAAVAHVTLSPLAGLACAIVVSVLLALLHGFASITHRGNQIVSGVAINFIASGLTATLAIAWFKKGPQTPQLPGEARFGEIAWPFPDLTGDLPVIGWLMSRVLFGHNVLTYVAFLAVPLTWWIIYRTRFGLRLRAVGENPAAVDTAGVSVAFLRYRALVCTGVLCGFAGTYLSIAQSSLFVQDMTAGKGYIALAALIFAKWRPVPVMFACLLFGFLDAVSIRMQGMPVPLIGEVPAQVFMALPYVLTVILLAGFIGKAIPPKAGGVPYTKER
ncbi:ABC transporter permease [Methylobrevis pamukkalensis]|uniref:Beta-methylgalactoside transporter inner membrane component n=1 Tax=Methylobrevis pamukkalensis TaxID=1439726 RepID=A0A1E3H444_9HYPH|nr:ABC transporter permease [Methylobrevis pamukkalensis]ODN70925.1 beta-methylgalactoside transporter inner membrane component [Methylobrevis pamukkalensis]